MRHTEGEANTSAARADWSARETHNETRDLLARDANAFLHQSLSSPCLSTIAKAEGIWIEDTSGRRFMDFHGNSVHHIGYGHPRLVQAVKDQIDALPFSPRRFTNDVSVTLAERLAQIGPGTLNRVLFTTGGSDAVEVALRLARAATGRFKTISFWDAFHGAGFGASSVGGEATFRSHIAGPLLPGAEHVAPFHCYHCAYGHPGPETCALACARMVEYALAREGDVAAVVYMSLQQRRIRHQRRQHLVGHGTCNGGHGGDEGRRKGPHRPCHAPCDGIAEGLAVQGTPQRWQFGDQIGKQGLEPDGGTAVGRRAPCPGNLDHQVDGPVMQMQPPPIRQQCHLRPAAHDPAPRRRIAAPYSPPWASTSSSARTEAP